MSTNDDNFKRMSRVALALGEGAIKQMRDFNVGIIGLSATGTEVVKNLMLTGVGSIEICDTKQIDIYDLGSNFFARKEDIENGAKRVDAILPRLKGLNPICSLTGTTDDFTDEWILKFKSLILTELLPFSKIQHISELCHKNNIQFIFVATAGPNAVLFEDFGQHFICVNPYGQPVNQASVDYVAFSAKGTILQLMPSDYDEVFPNGSIVKFQNIVGFPELNDLNAEILKSTGADGRYEIKIKTDKEIKGKFDRNAPKGKIIRVIQPREFSHKTINECLNNGVSNDDNFDKFVPSIRDMFVEIAKFWDEKGRPPTLFNLEDGNEISKRVNSQTPEIIKKASMLFSTEYPPATGIIGGCAAQECIKFCTKVFLPTQCQWFAINKCDVIGWKDDNIPVLNGCRYDSIIATVGNEIQSKIQNIRALIVGVGAIGCEYARYAALFGFNKIVLIDNDTVELSNLTRQFLFREEHKGSSKAEIGMMAILDANSDIPKENVIAYQDFFNDMTADKVGDDIDVVFSAVDTADGRNFISDFTALKGIPMINSGMEKHVTNFSYYIPKKTFKAHFKGENQINELACTIKNFPTKPGHLLQFSHNQFHKFFTKHPEQANIVIKSNARNVETSILKNGVNFLLEPPKNFDDCVKWALSKFVHVIENRPQNLIRHNEENSRKMKPVPFDKNNINHMKYLEAASKLKALVHGIEFNDTDIHRIPEIAASLLESNACNSEKDLNKFIVDQKTLISKFDSLNKKYPTINPLIFDKDNSLHLDYIEYYSRSRSDVFNIDMNDYSRLKILKIVGSIAPTLATTTAVAGAAPFSSFPMLFIDEIDYSFINPAFKTIPKRFDGRLDFIGLTLKFYGQMKPNANKKIGRTDKKFDCWDFIDVDDNPTLKELAERMKRELNVDDVSWQYGDIIIDSPNQNDHINDVIRKNVKNNCKYYLITQYLYTDNEDDKNLLSPPLRVIIKD